MNISPYVQMPRSALDAFKYNDPDVRPADLRLLPLRDHAAAKQMGEARAVTMTPGHGEGSSYHNPKFCKELIKNPALVPDSFQELITHVFPDATDARRAQLSRALTTVKAQVVHVEGVGMSCHIKGGDTQVGSTQHGEGLVGGISREVQGQEFGYRTPKVPGSIVLPHDTLASTSIGARLARGLKFILEDTHAVRPRGGRIYAHSSVEKDDAETAGSTIGSGDMIVGTQTQQDVCSYIHCVSLQQHNHTTLISATSRRLKGR